MNDDMVSIPKEQFDTLMLRAQVELLQRVNRLVELLEKQNEVLDDSLPR